jgi:hypothetical protein
MPLELGLMNPRQVPSSQLGGHLSLYDTPHTTISPVDPGLGHPQAQSVRVGLPELNFWHHLRIVSYVIRTPQVIIISSTSRKLSRNR